VGGARPEGCELGVRLAVLTCLLGGIVAGCLGTASTTARRDGCASCHPGTCAGRGACASCHRGNPDAARKELAHHLLLTGAAAWHLSAASPEVRAGAALVEQAACRRCHVIAGEGNGLATDLGAVVWSRSQQDLRGALDRPADSMPWFGFAPRQADRVIAYLLATRRPAAGRDAYRVRFLGAGTRPRSPAEQRCGPCHAALTPSGPLGRARDAPNLSGLFTPYYPATGPRGQRWTPDSVRAWIANPRAWRPGTTMPPVSVTDAEVAEIVRQLGSQPARALRAP
jgi:cytochrome c1